MFIRGDYGHSFLSKLGDLRILFARWRLVTFTETLPPSQCEKITRNVIKTSHLIRFFLNVLIDNWTSGSKDQQSDDHRSIDRRNNRDCLRKAFLNRSS